MDFSQAKALLRDTAARVLWAPATWRVGGAGNGVPCRAWLQRADTRVPAGRMGAVMEATMVHVRASEIAAPAKGDTVTIEGAAWTVIAKPMRDALDVWRCEVAL